MIFHTYKLILSFFLLSYCITSCNSPELNYSAANQISINAEGNIEIIGISENSSGEKYIKSPYVTILDKDLNQIAQHEYNTHTTAKNTKVFTTSDNRKVLSYYKSISLDHAIEQSHIIELDQNYQILEEQQFGERTRIHEVTELNDSLVALMYNRNTTATEIKSLYEGAFITSIKDRKEPCNPTDIDISSKGNLIFSAIQNGFQYPDGHDYNELSTYGIVGEINQTGEVVNQVTYEHDQHVFFSNVESNKDVTVVTGTKQQTGSSMDLLLLTYNDSLEIVHEKSYPKEGVQNGIKTVLYDQHYYTLIESENMQTHKMNWSLMKSDINLNTLWTKEYSTNESHKPADMIIEGNTIYCIGNVTTDEGSLTQAELHTLTLDGEIVKKKMIN